MMNLRKSHFKLLSGTLFTSISQNDHFKVVKSFITDWIWNYIVPKSKLTDELFEEANTEIEQNKSEREFSFYVPENLKEINHEFLLQKGYEIASVDIYIAKEDFSVTEVELDKNETFEEVSDSTFDGYLTLLKEAFEEWDNEEFYATTFYNWENEKDGKELRSFIIRNANEVIAAGSIIYSKEMNVAYFHNSATNNKYRRKGYFSKLKKLMMNYLVSEGVTNAYALVEEEGGSYHALLKLGFEENTKFYIYKD